MGCETKYYTDFDAFRAAIVECLGQIDTTPQTAGFGGARD
jgi:hypothetical protein